MITVSAPGSLMLFGEHAVLYGAKAIVMAHVGRIHVTCRGRDKGLWVRSDRHGEADLEAKDLRPEFLYVRAALSGWPALKKCGVTIEIRSDFSDQLGFGSSAALMASLQGAFFLWTEGIESADSLQDNDVRKILWRKGIKAIRLVQGVGSGADLAASLWGQVLLFQPPSQKRRLSVTPLTSEVPLVSLYSGYKEKTADVVAYVQERVALCPAIFDTLFEASEQITIQAAEAIQERHWGEVGFLMNLAHGLMESYGVNSSLLHILVNELRLKETIRGAKISGSGLGDCVIGLGSVDPEAHWHYDHDFSAVPVEVSKEGLHLDA